MFVRTAAATLALVAGQALAQQDTQPGRATNPRTVTPHQAQPMTRPQVETMRQHAQNVSMLLVPSDWVLGAKVLSSSNQEKIGSVKNLVINPADGRVDYAIVSHGGVAGIGDTLVAVPWDTFEYQSKDRVLAIGMTADQLKNAPEFKEDQWSMLGERTWRQKTHDFFGTTGGSKVGKADNDRDESWSESSNYQNMVKTGQRTTVRGTVKDIDNKSPGGDLSEGCIVTLTDQNGKDQIVHLGPSWFVKHQRTILKSGDQIEVTGTQFTYDGRDVIAAKSVAGPNGSFQFRDDQGRPAWDASTGGTTTTTVQRPGETTRTTTDNRQIADRPGGGERVLGAPEAVATHGYLKASTIKGQNLKTAQGEDAGEIKDFVFDVNSGRMGFLVVGFGGFLGIGDERVAVPWDAFSINGDGKLVLTDVSKDQLKAAPRLSKSDWSELSDPTFENRVYQSFGRTNHMTEHGPMDHPGNPGTTNPPGGGR